MQTYDDINNYNSMMDDSMNSYYSDDEEDDQGLQSMTNQLGRFQFTGMDRLRSAGGDSTDDSWDVESYAADSMEITKLRLAHIGLGYNEDDGGGSSLGQGSAAQLFFAQNEADDWTVQSDCNDSIGLKQNRLEFKHEQYNQVGQQEAPVSLPRITRRRASLGEFVKEEQGMIAPAANAHANAHANAQRIGRPSFRRMSMSSVATIEESLSSHGSGNSDDPAGGSSRRQSLTRHKSMPYVKATTSLSQTVPLWQHGTQPPRQKMQRRVSNNGTPCAA